MTKPTNYKLGVLTLYLEYLVQWRVDYALGRGLSVFNWGKIQITTQFVFTDYDQPMQFIEFKMWAQSAYRSYNQEEERQIINTVPLPESLKQKYGLT